MVIISEIACAALAPSRWLTFSQYDSTFGMIARVSLNFCSSVTDVFMITRSCVALMLESINKFRSVAFDKDFIYIEKMKTWRQYCKI